uniref:Caspase domain containing protein, putative n=1 Tax=Theileria annulata TaxID=5874 RepID=A0A3B0MVR9_THEAN
MSNLMDLYMSNVSNTDSGLAQCASENVESNKQNFNSFPANDKVNYQDLPNRCLKFDNKFQFHDNTYGSNDNKLDSGHDCLPNLEKLIHESVSRSTARLLTKNTLKYLDKGLMVKPGGGVSHQFTVVTPKHRENAQSTFLKNKNNDYEEGVGNESEYNDLRLNTAKSRLSTVRLNKVTYEMYKLFNNIKHFQNNTAHNESTEFAPANNLENENENYLNSSSRRLSIETSSLDNLAPISNFTNAFESRLRPNGLQSLSTAYPEDSTNLTYTSLNRFEVDHNQAQLSANLSNLEVKGSEETEFSDDFEASSGDDSRNYETYVSKNQFEVPVDLSAEPVKAQTLEYEEEKKDELDYTLYNSNKGKAESSKPVHESGNGGLNEFQVNNGTEVPEGTNKQKGFNTGYITRVYAPMDRFQSSPVKRAVVVGCNYLGNPDAQLRGCCNDAFVFAQVLVKRFNFDPKNVILLLDSRPSPAYTRNLSQFNNSLISENGFGLDLTRINKSVTERNIYPTKKVSMFGRHLVERNVKHLTLNDNMCLDSVVVPTPVDMLPTRGNIFRSLKWLNFSSSPNDFAVFFFSGHSVQVDDLSGYEGEGYDEALVPSDFQHNGLVTCNDLRCIFQSIGSTCRLNVFFDASNLQTVVGGSSRSGPVKGSMMKGFWPFSEPTGKLSSFECSDSVYKDPNMMNQMTKVKYLPTVEVDSLSSLSDVQLTLDATHGMVNYLVISSSNLKTVSIECLFKPLNLEQTYRQSKSNTNVRDDEVVVHGAFTYTLLLTLLYDRPTRRGGHGVDEVVEGINRKLSQLRRLRLPKLNQTSEVLFYHSSKLPKNTLLFPSTANKSYSTKWTSSLYGFLLPADAWMVLVNHGREKAKEQQMKFERMKTDLITLTNLNNKFFNSNTARTNRDNTNNLNYNEVNDNSTRLKNNKGMVKGTNSNLVEIKIKPVLSGEQKSYQPRTGRSQTNSLNSRVFTRNSGVSGRANLRSKTETVNSPPGLNYGEAMMPNWSETKHDKLMREAVQSHNWYGGCTYSIPMNPKVNNYSQATDYPTMGNHPNVKYSNDTSEYLKYQKPTNPFLYNKLQPVQLYEPITVAMLQQLPTSKSFNVT